MTTSVGSIMLALALPAALCCAAPSASAQMAAYRDLTEGWRVPSERISPPSTCAKVNASISTGSPGDSPSSQQPATALEVSIVGVFPFELRVGEPFAATVRLKNSGTEPILVPAFSDGEKLSHAAADGLEEKYEVGDVSFRLASGKSHATPIFLNTDGALFASPEEKDSYISLGPGQWLDIRLRAVVECGFENCSAKINSDAHGVLTALWYQRVLTHKVDGCNEIHGSVKVREVDSGPFVVAVRSAKSPGAEQ